MRASVATLTVEGISPYSQSRQHDAPKLEGESHEAYDIRTWREKMTVDTRHGKRTVVVPAHGFHQAIAAAAKYSKRQIPNQGKATWTAKFLSGIAMQEDPSLNIDPETVMSERISVNADGVRGSGKRVMRTFPVFPEWGFTTEIFILDPIITQDIFREMAEMTGLFIGLGRFRPEKGGTKGRFKIKSLTWADNRAMV